MLKSSGFAKSQIVRVHTGSFNPMTLSPGAAKELSQGGARRRRLVHKPAYSGLGAVFNPSDDI